MRVSAGFFVTGLSGKIRIQTLPPLETVIAEGHVVAARRLPAHTPLHLLAIFYSLRR
jgi:hypothetical protein